MSGIPPLTRIGAVELTVANLHRSLSFYEHAVGLRVHRREQHAAALGVGGEDLLRLVELQGAQPAHGFSGLYHFALLVPQRTDLARWLAHSARERIALAGLADHFVSEALYLSDPDGHGIEIYWDRPREHWEGRVAERMTTQPLDVGDLLSTLPDPAGEPFERLPAGTTVGHVHLRVGDVARAVDFYRDVLGFDLVASYGAQAAFLSAGGYHHHVGLNSWESAGAGQAPDGYATLQRARILLPDHAAVGRVGETAAAAGIEPVSVPGGVAVADPAGNRLLLSSSPAAA